MEIGEREWISPVNTTNFIKKKLTFVGVGGRLLVIGKNFTLVIASNENQ